MRSEIQVSSLSLALAALAPRDPTSLSDVAQSAFKGTGIVVLGRTFARSCAGCRGAARHRLALGRSSVILDHTLQYLRVLGPFLTLILCAVFTEVFHPFSVLT